MNREQHNLARVSKSTERMPTLSAERIAVEQCLQRAGGSVSPGRIATLTGVDRESVTQILQRLRRDGIACNEGNQQTPLWRLTRKQGDYTPPRRVTNSQMLDTYEGKELRPFDQRPGAMDFKALPSKGIR